MTYLDMFRHYTCAYPVNKVLRVTHKWEKYSLVSEWGYHWDGGYFVELTDGRFMHIWGWAKRGMPWENEAWVFCKIEDFLPADYDWKPYPIERTHIWEESQLKEIE